jgi:RNase H-fold protein (predicted Holliday junction resolvase)
MSDIVIAVDPGRAKCGIAVVHKHSGVLWKQVIETPQLVAVVTELALSYKAATVVIGNRTTHRSALAALSSIMVDGKPLNIKLVDEHRSSDEARSRYWLEYPPQGLLRFIPVTMRTPSVPVDDLVAVILAERYWKCHF